MRSATIDGEELHADLVRFALLQECAKKFRLLESTFGHRNVSDLDITFTGELFR